MQGLMPDKVVNRQTKHIPPEILPQINYWLARQSLVKNWIGELEKNKHLPPFINFPKFLKGYNYQPVETHDFNQLLSPRRKQIELIIRWFDINYK